MSLEYSKAKNETPTCKWNNIYLHSSYNPDQEAKRFTETLSPNFIPSNIIIIEPALSYCIPYLREKFPSSKIYAIRLIKDIKNEFKCDGEFLISDIEKIDNLESELFNYFGETELLNSFFITWPPAHNAFAEEDSRIWLMLKKLLKDCQSILATRQFFAERWIKNQINFLTRIEKTASINKTPLPVLICASGASLNASLSYIKKLQQRFFIISCSSSIKALLSNDIIPDLCISTDGGFWAKKHLNCLIKYQNEIKLAVSSESNIPSDLFSQNNITIVPLAYCDNYDSTIYEQLKIPYEKAKRNGTISGTALELAMNISSGNIYLCGIDLETSNGFVHTQPNELETENSIKDNKIFSKDKRTFMQGRDSKQLSLYRNWFINNSDRFGSRVFRVSCKHRFINKLGQIKDINFDDLIKMESDKVKNTADFFKKTIVLKSDKKTILSLIKNLINNDQWIKNYYPADCLMIDRSQDTDVKAEYKKKLDIKLSKLTEYISRQEKQ